MADQVLAPQEPWNESAYAPPAPSSPSSWRTPSPSLQLLTHQASLGVSRGAWWKKACCLSAGCSLTLPTRRWSYPSAGAHRSSLWSFGRRSFLLSRSPSLNHSGASAGGIQRNHLIMYDYLELVNPTSWCQIHKNCDHSWIYLWASCQSSHWITRYLVIGTLGASLACRLVPLSASPSWCQAQASCLPMSTTANLVESPRPATHWVHYWVPCFESAQAVLWTDAWTCSSLLALEKWIYESRRPLLFLIPSFPEAQFQWLTQFYSDVEPCPLSPSSEHSRCPKLWKEPFFWILH
jgi:hypothetical protein